MEMKSKWAILLISSFTLLIVSSPVIIHILDQHGSCDLDREGEICLLSSLFLNPCNNPSNR